MRRPRGHGHRHGQTEKPRRDGHRDQRDAGTGRGMLMVTVTTRS